MKRKSSKIIKTDNNLRYTEAFVIVSASETISSARCSEKIKIHGDVRITKAKPIMPDIFMPSLMRSYFFAPKFWPENADAVNRSLEGVARLFAKKKIELLLTKIKSGDMIS